MPPDWLTILARHSIAAGLVSAAVILYDIYARGRRQPVRVIEAVWPITAPLGWFVYAHWATSSLNRPCSQARGRSQAQRWPEHIVDLTLAWVLGILFQYFAITPMSGLAPARRSHGRSAPTRSP